MGWNVANWGCWSPEGMSRTGRWVFDGRLTPEDMSELKSLKFDPDSGQVHQCKSGLVCHWERVSQASDCMVDPEDAALVRYERRPRVIEVRVPSRWIFGAQLNAPVTLTIREAFDLAAALSSAAEAARRDGVPDE